jgi:simple sugar transport system ATP-binding protein
MTLSSGGPPDVLIELCDITVEFGALRALDKVSMHINAGEVVGLLGDNGAGKSTLLKVITGYHQPASGAIRIFGEQRRLSSPAVARQLGVETVYQDLALIDELSVWRNFFLGKELRRGVGPLSVLRRAEMRRISEQELARIGIRRVRTTEQRVLGLSGGERQSLAIIRAMHFGARVLLLDEPTAALSVRETRRVFAAIQAARDAGHGILYIDHNINHLHSIVDRVVILERGRITADVPKAETTVAELAKILGGASAEEEPDTTAEKRLSGAQ